MIVNLSILSVIPSNLGLHFETMFTYMDHCSIFLEDCFFYQCASLFLLMFLASTFDINDINIILPFYGYNFGGILSYFNLYVQFCFRCMSSKQETRWLFNSSEDFFPIGEFNQLIFSIISNLFGLISTYFVCSVYHLFCVFCLSSFSSLYVFC